MNCPFVKDLSKKIKNSVIHSTIPKKITVNIILDRADIKPHKINPIIVRDQGSWLNMVGRVSFSKMIRQMLQRVSVLNLRRNLLKLYQQIFCRNKRRADCVFIGNLILDDY